jgi:6-phosphogluconolactonase
MPTPSPELKTLPDLHALQRVGADEIIRCAKENINTRGSFSIALSGGSTPQGMYAMLAGEKLPWDKIQIFFGDERHVPPDNPQSNYGMAYKSLLSKISIPPESVHRVRAELDAETAARQYEDELRSFFHQTPRFDLILLGMGPEGHTASLFPGSAALKETQRWVAANWVEKLNTWRITFTFPVLNNAAEVLFVVAGHDKAEVLKQVLEGEPSDEYPAQRVRPSGGRLLWYVEADAARLLQRKS